MEEKHELMEAREVIIGRYKIKSSLKNGVLEVVVFDELGKRKNSITVYEDEESYPYINDWDEDFDDEESEDSEEGEGDDDDTYYDEKDEK